MKIGTILRFGIVGFLVAVGGFVFFRYDVQTELVRILTWINAQGAVGVTVYIVVYVAATVLFVPGSVITLGAGFIYGVVYGSIYVSIASTIGALFAFLVGRYLARGWIERRVADNKSFAAIDAAVGREGWKIVLLTRLSPVMPFNLLNYSYGLSGVPAGHYLLASWIGMMPGTVMWVYIGTLFGSLATIGADSTSATNDTFNLVILIVGFVLVVAVAVYVGVIAKRALAVGLDTEPEA